MFAGCYLRRMPSRAAAGGHFEKKKPMNKIIRCAVVALMLTPAVSAVQAQEMRPLSEVLETAAAPYPSTRCAGWYQALMEWAGKERFDDETWATMDAARQSVFLHSVLIFNKESGNMIETDVELIAQNARSVADLYLARMKSNYAAQGEAYGQDELIKGDMFLCQIVAELAVAESGNLDQ
jgi:hypothetical protein